uniref:Pentacotripeptide-repeat region of PRORP domain-containing protein n=1 Tax=Oryza rufipogon TaxID=4529 RepID=A0A0E0Q126_ORYRU
MYANNGLHSKATELFDSIKQSRLNPTLIIYNSLMDMYAKSNESWEAENILKQLESSQVKPDVASYNTVVVNGFCLRGLIKDAQRILSEMIADGIGSMCCNFMYDASHARGRIC